MIHTMAMCDPKVWRDLYYGDERPYGMARSILWRCATLRYGAIYTMAMCDPIIKVWRDTHYGDARKTLKVRMIHTMAIYYPEVWRDLNYGDERP